MIDSGSLLETLKSLILDYQEMELPTGVPRRLRIETVPGKATVCIGVRRGGKSTYLYQVIARLLEQGVPRQSSTSTSSMTGCTTCGTATSAWSPMRTSPSIRRRRTSRRCIAFSTRSRRLRAGSRSSTACCAPNAARSISRDRRRNCCRGRSPPRCAGERCPGRSSRSRSGNISTIGGSTALATCRPSGASRSSRHSPSTGSGEAFPRSPAAAAICGSGSIRSTSTRSVSGSGRAA